MYKWINPERVSYVLFPFREFIDELILPTQGVALCYDIFLLRRNKNF
jgi:hypothetical protein